MNPRRFRFIRGGSLPDLIRALPPRQSIPFWIAVFCTFAMVGFALDINNRGREPALLLTLNVVMSGVLAVGFAMVSLPMRGSALIPARMRPWVFAALVAIHATYVALAPRVFALMPEAPPSRLMIDAIGTIVAVTISYTCFVRFITSTAARYLRAQAEIAIARDIHRVLVPAIEARIGDFEFFGWSHASERRRRRSRRRRSTRSRVGRLRRRRIGSRRRTRRGHGHVQERAAHADDLRRSDSIDAR